MLKRFIIQCAAMAALQWAGLPAFAQTPIEQDPAVRLQCLSRPQGLPDYPAALQSERKGGSVRIAFRFEGPDSRPEVEVLFRTAPDALVQSVRAYVRDYRLPCMRPGQRAISGVQTFSFEPMAQPSVSWLGAAADPGSTDERDLSRCLRTPEEKPEYRGIGARWGAANVLAIATFTAPDAPPKVEVRYAGGASEFLDYVKEYMGQYRLPCLEAGDRPWAMEQHFVLNRSDGTYRRFKDAMQLGPFLSSIKDIEASNAYFDLNSMHCPFDVVWHLRKPVDENPVGEVGPHDPNRTEFLRWLSGLQMNLPAGAFQELFDQPLTLKIGCGVVDLRHGPASPG